VITCIVFFILLVIEGRQIYKGLKANEDGRKILALHTLLGISAEQRNASGMSDKEAQRILDEHLGRRAAQRAQDAKLASNHP
jgi:hypothetical protein